MAALFNFASKSSTPRPKMHVSHGTLPAHIDPRQPPTKRSPWRQIRDMPFVSSVTITLPTSCYDVILPDLHPGSPSPTPSTIPSPRYFKLLAPLSDILAPAFVNPFIKTGDVVLLSEGVPGVCSSCVRICGGKLFVEMAREVYEQAGLQGRVVERNGGARKHGRDRWAVEMDLRAPEMVPGRKGFERLVRAAGGVLGEGRAWVGRDVTVDVDTDTNGHGREQREAVLQGLHAVIVDGEPDVETLQGVVVPAALARWKGATSEKQRLSEFEDDYQELIEWLDLVKMKSPRVLQGDSADPYISRYIAPDQENGDVADLKVVTWSGLLDREWCTRLVIELVRRSRRAKRREWLAVTINSHRTEALGQIEGCTIAFHINDHEDHEQNEVDTVMQEGEAVEQDRVSHHGFQHFTCCQFVDTITT